LGKKISNAEECEGLYLLRVEDCKGRHAKAMQLCSSKGDVMDPQILCMWKNIPRLTLLD